MARRGGIIGASVTWHITRLEEDNIIISKNGGRSVHYLLNKNNCGYQTQSICPSGVDATG
ncbi:hypothetical protein [Methanogenium cariaci]|jgi:predicted transcriptional regulator